MEDRVKAIIVADLNAHQLRSVIYIHGLECENRKRLDSLRRAILSSAITAEDVLISLTKAEIQWFLQVFGLKETGSKATLIARVLDAVKDDPDDFILEEEEEPVSSSNAPSEDNSPAGVEGPSSVQELLNTVANSDDPVTAIDLTDWQVQAYRLYLAAMLRDERIRRSMPQRRNCPGCGDNHLVQLLDIGEGLKHYACLKSASVTSIPVGTEEQTVSLALWMEDHYFNSEQCRLIRQYSQGIEFDPKEFEKAVSDKRSKIAKFLAKRSTEVNVSPIPPFVTVVIK